MTVTTDPDKLNFNGNDPIDKIVYEGTVTGHNSGPSGSSYVGSDNITVVTAQNPYGKRTLCNYKWSIDGTNYNNPQTVLYYSFTVDASFFGGPVSDPIPGTKAGVAVGVGAQTITFQLFNGWHGNVTYTAGDDSYTSNPLDFTVKYTLFEVE